MLPRPRVVGEHNGLPDDLHEEGGRSRVDVHESAAPTELAGHFRDAALDLVEAPEVPTVTPQSVTEFYNFRTSVQGCKNLEALIRLAKSYGVEVGFEQVEQEKEPSRVMQKDVMQRHHSLHYPHARTLDEHRERLVAIEHALQEHLQTSGSRSILFSFGSYALGKVNSFLTDFDGLLVIPKDTREGDIVRGFEQAGLVFSDELNHFEDIDEIARTGKGLARLYAMSTGGVEVEFHVIGMEDVSNMHKMKPKSVRRIRPVPAKKEWRVSFTGRRDSRPKGPDEVLHYDEHDGQMYRGFFPEGMLVSNVVYDGTRAQQDASVFAPPAFYPDDTDDGRAALPPQRSDEGPTGPSAEEMQDNIWFANVKAFLFHNGFYQTLPDGRRAVMEDRATFDRFVTTLFTNDRDRYTRSKLEDLDQRFSRAVATIIQRYGMVRVNRALPALVDRDGAPLSEGMQQLHALRRDGVDVIGMNYEGTLVEGDGTNDHQKAAELIIATARGGKSPVVFSAGDADVRRQLSKPLAAAFHKDGDVSLKPIFLSVSNGRALYEIDASGERLLYVPHDLQDDETASIASTYRHVLGDLGAEASDFAWKDGSLHIEGSQVALRLPAGPEREACIAALTDRLQGAFDIVCDGDIMRVMRKLETDGRLHAMQSLTGYLGAEPKNVVMFSNAPASQDAVLAEMPNSFTAAEDAPRGGKQPHILEGKDTPVQKVHHAVEFLLK
jgi:hypothetical protein